MNYVGIDIHKKYSVLCAQDERGRTLREARIDGNSADGFETGRGQLQNLALACDTLAKTKS